MIPEIFQKHVFSQIFILYCHTAQPDVGHCVWETYRGLVCNVLLY